MNPITTIKAAEALENAGPDTRVAMSAIFGFAEVPDPGARWMNHEQTDNRIVILVTAPTDEQCQAHHAALEALAKGLIQ